ncbi:hypothetical protein ACQKNB_15175 [Lysinibacillus xylanilyticus]|uniref:hypothetical protein n=1 Tax=Lysinibacillus xylanilyticus TaxID=582475 RepID=UPI003D01DFE7
MRKRIDSNNMYISAKADRSKMPIADKMPRIADNIKKIADKMPRIADNIKKIADKFSRTADSIMSRPASTYIFSAIL